MGTADGSCQCPWIFGVSVNIVDKDLFETILTRTLTFTGMLRIRHSSYTPAAFFRSLSSVLEGVTKMFRVCAGTEVVVLVVSSFKVISCYSTHNGLSNDHKKVSERDILVPVGIQLIDAKLGCALIQSLVVRVVVVYASISTAEVAAVIWPVVHEIVASLADEAASEFSTLVLIVLNRFFKALIDLNGGMN